MSTYREERRRDEEMRAASEREDRRLELQAQLQAQQLKGEEKRRDAEAKAERKRKEEEAARRQRQQDKRQRQQEKQRKAAGRRAKVARVVRWFNANPVTVFVGFVMLSAIVPAVISQVGALSDAGVFGLLAALLAAMLEGSAWALTFMGKTAEDEGRSTTKYRIGTWTTAVMSAAVNYWHWAQKLPHEKWVAVVFAASSLVAIYLWDMKTHGSSGKSREERREEKARREHEKNKRKHHKEVAEAADRLVSAVGFGQLTESEAFAAAWRIHYGAEPGLTPELYSQATTARLTLGAAIDEGAENAPEGIRAGILAALHNPLPGKPGSVLPTLSQTVSVERLEGPAKDRTTQFPQGKGTLSGSADSGPQKPAKKALGKAAKATGNTERDGDWERHLDRAREVAVDLLAEGKTISATSLAKRLKVRREDAMKLRDVIVAERKGNARPLQLVPTEDEPAAVAAGA
ncbi:DUF2637 domain-containing protein [Streptomyces sp. VTCC 41912]|uniref:DUF2637 domain-containing protein n=1 Tax=Streptomyces sp. VTCC 41912 TaxID=3383243 RepID=UPI0038969194